jgi:hypothetical protein
MCIETRANGGGTCESDDNLLGVYELIWWVFFISSLVHLINCFVFYGVELLGDVRLNLC